MKRTNKWKRGSMISIKGTSYYLAHSPEEILALAGVQVFSKFRSQTGDDVWFRPNEVDLVTSSRYKESWL